MTSTDLVHVPRRTSVIRRYLAVAVLGVAELIRASALLAIVVVVAASFDPRSGWNLDVPWPALAVVVLALLGVERVGLAVAAMSDTIREPASYIPNLPQHPAH